MKTVFTKRVLYFIAVLMIAGWVASLLFFVTGMFVHLLLLLAVFIVMQATIITPKPTSDRH
ncbi:MAG: DUF5670 family protein [Chitinophagaceae bacterium]